MFVHVRQYSLDVLAEALGNNILHVQDCPSFGRGFSGHTQICIGLSPSLELQGGKKK